jgi:hypothetical protein
MVRLRAMGHGVCFVLLIYIVRKVISPIWPSDACGRGDKHNAIPLLQRSYRPDYAYIHHSYKPITDQRRVGQRFVYLETEIHELRQDFKDWVGSGGGGVEKLWRKGQWNSIWSIISCKISGFHGGHYEECRLLGYKHPVRTSQETHYVSDIESSQLMLCTIWGVHGSDYEEFRLVGYKTQFVLHRRHITSPLQSPVG